jgi:hypothetical protein
VEKRWRVRTWRQQVNSAHIRRKNLKENGKFRQVVYNFTPAIRQRRQKGRSTQIEGDCMNRFSKCGSGRRVIGPADHKGRGSRERAHNPRVGYVDLFSIERRR